MQKIHSSNPPVGTLEVVIIKILEQTPSQFKTWLEVEVSQHLNY